MIKACRQCRVCGGTDLRLIVDLGSIYPSTFVSDKGQPIGPFPLTLLQCADCELVQLGHTLDLDLSYRQYWYASALNKTMVAALTDVYEDMRRRVRFSPGDVVIDIGCNDGTFLRMFPKEVLKIGVDPARNLAERAREHCDIFINDYFTADRLSTITRGRVSVISSIAMFYDLEDPNVFVEDIKKLLADSGLWVIQLMDLKSMVETNAFDNICFEHLEYYSLKGLIALLERHGLAVVDVSYNDVNGGSIRVFVRKSPAEIAPAVSLALSVEAERLRKFPVEKFGARLSLIVKEVRRLVDQVRERGPVYVLGASTKGNTLLQICGLDASKLEKALEVNPDKFGMRTVATNIPIIPEEQGLAEKPAGLLVLPWHFLPFFETRLAAYMRAGGCLIVPLPEPRIITG